MAATNYSNYRTGDTESKLNMLNVPQQEPGQ